MSGYPQTTRGYADGDGSSDQFVYTPQPNRQNNGYARGDAIGNLIGMGIKDLTAEELHELAALQEVLDSKGPLSDADAAKYKALMKKGGCGLRLGLGNLDFSYIQKQLSPSAGGWCAFISSLLACMMLAVVCGWTVAAAETAGSEEFNMILGPLAWGTATAVILLIATFSMCPPELNFWIHLCKFFFDKERVGDNLGFHVGHFFGGIAGWFLGYVIVWLVFENNSGSYEEAVAYVRFDFSVGRAIITETLFTFILCLGSLAITIIVPYWAVDRKSKSHLSKHTARLLGCLAEGVLIFTCSIATWNVTGAGLNLFRWLAAATMNGGWSYAVASSWWVYLVSGCGALAACLLFWAFYSLTGFKVTTKTE